METRHQSRNSAEKTSKEMEFPHPLVSKVESMDDFNIVHCTHSIHQW